MKKELVLCIDTEHIINVLKPKCSNQFIEITEQQLNTLMCDINHLFILPREFAEPNSEYRQVIPYVVIKQKDKILCYKRTIAAGEERLHHKISIGLGGHINSAMLVHTRYELEPICTLLKGAKCEVSDELETQILNSLFCRIPIPITPRIPDEDYRLPPMSLMGAIWANETPVDSVHLGLTFLINADDIPIRLPEHINEDGLSQYQWLNPQDVLITYEHELETWSKLLLHFSPLVKYII